MKLKNMLKIIIPLGGSSELFSSAGYFYPKPLIEVKGKPMIELVLENPSKIKQEKHFIFIVKEEDCNKFHLDNTLKILCPGSTIIKLKNDTKGGLCSVLMAIDEINQEDSIIILNGDQVIDKNLSDIISYWITKSADAGLVTFKSVHPRWSYARVVDEVVVQTAEKNPISNNAIAGVYYFKNAKNFFKSAYATIKNDVQLDGKYYISPVINDFVLSDLIIIPYHIETKEYHLFYSPQVLHEFERK
jgi:NDP-sugar pyrophosphorylase family protein